MIVADMRLEGNHTIAMAFVPAAAESWKDHAIYFENLLI